MFNVIALEEVRMPHRVSRFRDAQIAAIRLTRKWESACVIMDDRGRVWGETVYVNWPKRDMPKCGSMVRAYYGCEGKRVI